MTVFTTKKDLQSHLLSITNNTNSSLGFIPTMGALHIGHISLVEQSLKENLHTVVSIFVNPTQFNNTTDLDHYPRNLDKDIQLLKQTSNSIIVFSPSVNELYGSNLLTTNYNFGGIEHKMEGKHRPGHFDGVGTVLKLFFNCIKPTTAYFGEKDFQQLQIVKKLVELEKLPISIIGCPIYRESHGLAFSSRNERLSSLERKEAKVLFKTLNLVKSNFGTKSVTEIRMLVINIFKNLPGFKLEYFEIAAVSNLESATQIKPNTKYRAFLAVFVNEVRLIDNIALN